MSSLSHPDPGLWKASKQGGTRGDRLLVLALLYPRDHGCWGLGKRLQVTVPLLGRLPLQPNVQDVPPRM